MPQKPKRRIEKRPLNSLTPHPAQGNLFEDLDDAELQRLADDMQENGQNAPIEILPDGRTICGHQRVRAAKRLGWTHLVCWVREDLEAEGANAVEARLITDNRNRRHLGKLSKVRLEVRQMEIEEGCFLKDFTGWQRDRLRERVKDVLQMSKKSAERYMNILTTPIEVQHAFERDDLILVQAVKVSRLPDEQQADIAAMINAGKPAKDAVQQFVSVNGRPKTLGAKYRRWMKALKDAQELFGNFKKIKFAPDNGDVGLLRAASRKLKRLADHLERNAERCAQTDSELAELLEDL